MLTFETFRKSFYPGFGYETASVLLERASDEFHEITPFIPGVRVEWYDEDSGEYLNGEITETDSGISGDWLTVETDDGEEYCVDASNVEPCNDDKEEIPAYFYTTDESALQSYLGTERGQAEAVEVGFRVYETPDDYQIARDCTDHESNDDAFRDLYNAYMENHG